MRRGVSFRSNCFLILLTNAPRVVIWKYSAVTRIWPIIQINNQISVRIYGEFVRQLNKEQLAARLIGNIDLMILVKPRLALMEPYGFIARNRKSLRPRPKRSRTVDRTRPEKTRYRMDNP